MKTDQKITTAQIIMKSDGCQKLIYFSDYTHGRPYA